MDHFEQLLLLFNNFELNGARNQRENQLLREVLGGLTSAEIERLSDKHDMAPLYAKPWQKRLYGGSDDHSSSEHRAHPYPVFAGDADEDPARALRCLRPEVVSDDPVRALRCLRPEVVSDDPVRALRCLRPEVVSDAATPLTMSHNLYAIAYQFYRGKFKLDRYAEKDILMRFLDRNLRADVNRAPGILSKLFLLWQYRRREKREHQGSGFRFAHGFAAPGKHASSSRKILPFTTTTTGTWISRSRRKKWFTFVNRVSKRVMLHFGNHLLDHLSGANLFNIFATIGSGRGALHPAGALFRGLFPVFQGPAVQ